MVEVSGKIVYLNDILTFDVSVPYEDISENTMSIADSTKTINNAINKKYNKHFSTSKSTLNPVYIKKDNSETSSEQADPFLESLVSSSDVAGVEIGITLMVKGAIISGTLFSAGNYYAAFAKLISNASNNKFINEYIVKPIEDGARGMKKMLLNNSQRSIPAPLFIHLKNCRIINPHGVMNISNIGIWRGRLHEVDGFILGTIDESHE